MGAGATCVRWLQVTMCDLVWQVMLLSSEMDYIKSYMYRQPSNFLKHQRCRLFAHGQLLPCRGWSVLLVRAPRYSRRTE